MSVKAGTHWKRSMPFEVLLTKGQQPGSGGVHYYRLKIRHEMPFVLLASEKHSKDAGFRKYQKTVLTIIFASVKQALPTRMRVGEC